MIFASRERSSEDLDAALTAFLYCAGSRATLWWLALFTMHTVGGLEKVIAMSEKVTDWV